MKIVIAPDSFKGSISATEASSIMERAIKSVFPLAQTMKKPMADGGEGTLDAISSSKSIKKISFDCKNAQGKLINTQYLVIDDDTVVIEYAMIAGIAQLNEMKTPEIYTSYGLGEAILDALNKGYTNLFIALGGSATNDAGLGMLSALGAIFSDRADNKVGYYSKDVHAVNQINLTHLDKRLEQANITVIADVTNPLCGKLGASYVYGPQKGLTLKQVEMFDKSFAHLSKLTTQILKKDFSTIAGAGAAGGLGFSLLLLGATIQPGAQTIADIIQLEKEIANADLIVTGEGKSDYQTLFGKAPAHVAELGLKYGTETILLSGAVEDREKLNQLFLSCFSITAGPTTLRTCIKQADGLVYKQMKQIMQLVRAPQ